MEDETAVSKARRTRSSKAGKTPPTKAAVKAVAKPASRRTRKKVVVMEVEVSDDEDETQEDNAAKVESDQELDEKKGDEKISESEGVKASANGNNSAASKPNIGEVNGSVVGDLQSGEEDLVTVVCNDIEMLEVPEESEKMEVDVVPDKITETKKVVETLKNSEVPDTPKSVPESNEKAAGKVNEQPVSKTEDADKAEVQKNKLDSPKKTKDEHVEKDKKSKKKDHKTEDENIEKQTKEGKSEISKKDDAVGDTKSENKETAVKVVEKKDENQDKKEEKDKNVEETNSAVIQESKEANASKIEVEEDDVLIVSVTEKKVTEVKETSEVKEKTKITDKDKEKSDKDIEVAKKPKTEVKEESDKDKVEDKTKTDNKQKSDKDSDVEEKIKIEERDLESPEPEKTKKDKKRNDEQKGDPDAENISEDELPGVPVVKVPEAEEVSDEELPGPKRAELPADTEVVSEDELPSVKNEEKKEGVKRKLNETDYDPGSPTSESEVPTKKPSLEATAEKDEKPKPKKLPELDKYWKAVNDDPTDFTGWTYLLQYVDQENDMEAAREAYDAFLSHYPYCYGYWRKYADYEKRKGNKKKCEEVFERGLKAIPLSVDLWIHYLTYVKTSRTEEEEYVRSQFERALTACGLEFRSDRLWDSYIKWEAEGKRLQKVTAIYDRLLTTPTQGYTTHFDNFQEHIASNPPNKVVEVDEFLALRKEVRHQLKHDVSAAEAADTDAPPGDEDQSKVISSDEETKLIRERIVSIRRKMHKTTVNAVTARWNYEEGIKRPYFHVKPLERCQLKNWHDYLDYESEQGDRVRIIVLFERCLIACALYEEFWLKFVNYLENLKDAEFQTKIRDVYERACTIHHLKKPSLHLQWAMFEESVENVNRAAEILVNLEKSLPNVLQIAYRRINLERRRGDHEKCVQLYEHYMGLYKNKMIASNIAIKYSRFCMRVMMELPKAQEVLKTAITKDPNNPRLYLQLIDLTLQKENVTETEVIEIIDSFIAKESTDLDQKVLFAQRKLEYLEDFGKDTYSVQVAYDQYQKIAKQSKESKKKETKTDTTTSAKKEKTVAPSSSQSSSYSNYGSYGPPNQPAYPYAGSQQGQYNYSQYGQGDQYQYQNWQYPQGGYGGYNQWGSYGGGYGY